MNTQFTRPTVSPPPELIARFTAIVGDRYAITDPAGQQPYLIEGRGLYRGITPMVLRPGSVEEVAAIVKLANETATAIVPQGGNTGLVGGQISLGGEVVLSLARLDRIREVDALSNTMTCEAGVVLAKVQEAAAEADRLFPLSLGAEGSCTIGGNLSSNAGGTGALAYGVARDLVLGLEVVLADGRVLNVLNKLKKDNTGYDLRNLFIGAEGTLGIITAAVLKLFPRPRTVETAFIGVPSPQPWYVLLELSSSETEGLRDTLEGVLAAGMEAGLIADATIAASLAQRQEFWKLREVLPEVQKPEGGSIKHDVSVPLAHVPAFLAEADAAVAALIPGARPVPFGHLGDGNMHYNVTQPAGANGEKYLARWYDMNAAVHAVVKKYGGSISAEHGIGVMKRRLLPDVKDPVALDLMRTLKRTLDPKGILNPGKVL